jgi:glutathione S-transferase
MLDKRGWIAGSDFSTADCAAASASIYASTLVPLPPSQRRLATYFERLPLKVSIARTLDEAQPYFDFYPYRESIPQIGIGQIDESVLRFAF